MDKKDTARDLYSKGESMANIARKLGVSSSTVRSWKNRGGWDESVATKSRNKKTVATKIIDAVEEPENLNEQQKLFCEYYVRNFNGTQAAIKAGYSPKTAYSIANRLLKKVEIQKYIKELKYAKMAVANLDSDDLVEMWMRIAFADLTDFVKFSNYSVSLVDSKKVDGQVLSAVSEGKDGISIKLVDKAKALTWLSNYFDLNPQHKHRVTYDNARLELENQKLAKDGIDDEKIILELGGEDEIKE